MRRGRTAFPGDAGVADLREFTRYLADRTEVLVATTSNHEDSFEALYRDSAADIATWHFSRDRAADDGWRPVIDCRRLAQVPGCPPVSSNEPIGPGASVASESDPAQLVLAAAYAFASRLPMYVFHSEAGVFGRTRFEDTPVVRDFRHLARLLPGDLANWTSVEAREPGSLLSADGCVSLVCCRKGERLVCVPVGIRREGLALTARCVTSVARFRPTHRSGVGSHGLRCRNAHRTEPEVRGRDPDELKTAQAIQSKPRTMNRRQFLSSTAAVTAALSVPSPLRTAESLRRIPIGFLGATYSHGPDKIKLATTSPDWEFVGVCDESAAGRAACAKLGAKLISQGELFQRARVVAVESEVRDHAAHALLALRAGKHVHLEKPPATKLADIQAVVALAREKKLLLQTGFMWRYNPGFTAIFEAVRQGWLGDVFLVRGYVSNNVAPARRPEWAEFEGGAMFELGSHLVDATVRLLGRPKSVTPFLRRHGRFADSLKDNNVAVLEYDRATAVLINTALQPGGTPPRSFEVLGTNGTATLAPLEPPTLTFDLATAAGPYARGTQRVPLPAYQRYVDDFKELAAAVRGEKALTATLVEELLVAETVLRVSEMP